MALSLRGPRSGLSTVNDCIRKGTRGERREAGRGGPVEEKKEQRHGGEKGGMKGGQGASYSDLHKATCQVMSGMRGLQQPVCRRSHGLPSRPTPRVSTSHRVGMAQEKVLFHFIDVLFQIWF